MYEGQQKKKSFSNIPMPESCSEKHVFFKKINKHLSEDQDMNQNQG